MLKQNLDVLRSMRHAQNGYTEIVKIFTAALFGNKKIIQILAPLTDYPNAPNENGRTPIEIARNTEFCTA